MSLPENPEQFEAGTAENQPEPPASAPAAVEGNLAEAAPAEVPRQPTAAHRQPTEPLRPAEHGQGFLALLSVIVIALFVITFVVQAFQIPSESMEKTLLIGDYLLVDKVHFGESGPLGWILPYRDIRRGDIVVFHYPVDPSQHFVKRVIGLPGDRIRINEMTVLVNDVPLNESYVVHSMGNIDMFRDNFPADLSYYTPDVNRNWRAAMHRYIHNGELVVPPGEYFVMGDNRDRSLDSRYWGFVPRENIVGRPLVVYLSLREAGEPAGNRNDFAQVRSNHVLAHMWQFARWDRMFHLVR